jgi:GT2 family glycosyltransferase
MAACSTVEARPRHAPGTGQPALMTLAIGIATRGRPGVLQETLADLALQTRPGEGIFVAYTDPADIEDAADQFPHVRFVKGAAETGGSCAQRNRLLNAAAGDAFDLIFFMDDDFYLQREYLERLTQVFVSDPSVLGATGKVIADGAKGVGLTGAYARAKLKTIAELPSLEEQPPVPAYNTYGCNMAFRMEALLRLQIRFDEELPAYGWYEDIDLSRRLLPFGKLVRIPSAQGIHLGVKTGRTSGKRFGYSQVANCIYLSRKGSYPWREARWSILRNMLANMARSVRPEPYVDRRGRLLGNFLALWDLARGRMHPRRILEMQ